MRGEVDEFEPGDVAHGIVAHVGDLAADDPRRDDDGSVAQMQPQLMGRADEQGVRAFHVHPGVADIADGYRGQDAHFPGQRAEQVEARRFPMVVWHALEYTTALVVMMGAGEAGMEALIRQLLVELGEDPDREGLQATPRRVAKSFKFLTGGYDADVDQVINDALFTVDYSEMVIVKDIDFFSLCEHHLLPFFGKCHVAYIPKHKVIGLSKIPRLVDIFARRLQVQERLTNQIAETIKEKIDPLGVAVVMEATHLCMSMRGVEKQRSFCVTSAMLGAFRERDRTRAEFLELIRQRHD